MLKGVKNVLDNPFCPAGPVAPVAPDLLEPE